MVAVLAVAAALAMFTAVWREGTAGSGANEQHRRRSAVPRAPAQLVAGGSRVRAGVQPTQAGAPVRRRVAGATCTPSVADAGDVQGFRVATTCPGYASAGSRSHFSSIALPNGDVLVIGGRVVKQVSSVYRGSSLGQDWELLNPAPGFAASDTNDLGVWAPGPRPNGTVVYLSQTEDDYAHRAWVSSDLGATWTAQQGTLVVSENQPTVTALHNGSVLVVGGGEQPRAVQISNDLGATWVLATNLAPFPGTWECGLVVMPDDTVVLLTGYYAESGEPMHSMVYNSTDGGWTWNLVNPVAPFMKGSKIRDTVFVPFPGAGIIVFDVYHKATKTAWASADAGATWRAYSSALGGGQYVAVPDTHVLLLLQAAEVLVSSPACGLGAGVANATHCGACSPGTSSIGGFGATCAPCTGGTFASGHTSVTCQACPAGKWSASGSTQCSGCQPGTYSTGGAPTCTACPIGTYQPLSNATSDRSCIGCPTGTHGVRAAAGSMNTGCSNCGAGRYANVTGQANCTLCGPGTFSTATNAKSAATCQQCPRGSASGTKGATDCTVCRPGTYAATPGTVTCTPCRAGTYGTAANATSDNACVSCPIGQFSTTPGATTCRLCGAGRFTRSIGTNSSKLCVRCPVGTFSPTDGGACRNCTRGAYCPAGTVVPGPSVVTNLHVTRSVGYVNVRQLQVPVLQVSWGTPDTGGGVTGNATVANYTVTVLTDSGPVTTHQKATNFTTNPALHLQPGKQYQVTVAAVNSDGVAGLSLSNTATALVAPAKPASVSCWIDTATRMVHMTWAPVEFWGGAPTPGTYVVTRSPGPSAPVVTNTSATLGLAEVGIAYTCTVGAKNAAGEGATNEADAYLRATFFGMLRAQLGSTLIVTASVVVIVVAGTALYLDRKYKRGRRRHFAPLWVAWGMYHVASDVLFTFQLAVQASRGKISIAWGVVYGGLVVVPAALNAVMARRFIVRRLRRGSDFVQWHLRHQTMVTVCVLLSSFKPSALGLMTSRVCGVRALSAPPPHPVDSMWLTTRSLTLASLEDVPQLIIAVVAAVDTSQGLLNVFTFMALSSSCVSVLVTLFKLVVGYALHAAVMRHEEARGSGGAAPGTELYRLSVERPIGAMLEWSGSRLLGSTTGWDSRRPSGHTGPKSAPGPSSEHGRAVAAYVGASASAASREHTRPLLNDADRELDQTGTPPPTSSPIARSSSHSSR